MKTVRDIIDQYGIKLEVRLTRQSKWPEKDPEGSMDEFSFTLSSSRFKLSGPYSTGIAYRVATMREFFAIKDAFLPAQMQSEIGAKLRAGSLRLMDYQRLTSPKTIAEASAAKAFKPALPSIEMIFASVVDDAMSIEGCGDVDDWARMYYGPTTKIAEAHAGFERCQKWNRTLRNAFGDAIYAIYEITKE